jgi:hypothetical protein
MVPADVNQVNYAEPDGGLPDHAQDPKDALAEHRDAANIEPDGKDMADAYVVLPSYDPDADEPADIALALGAWESPMAIPSDDDDKARGQRAAGGVGSNGQAPAPNAGGHDVAAFPPWATDSGSPAGPQADYLVTAVDYLEAVDDTPAMHNPLYLESKDLVPAPVPDYLTCVDDLDGTDNYAVPSDIITEADLTHGGMVMEADLTQCAEPPTEFRVEPNERRESCESASSYVTFSGAGDDLSAGLNDGDVPASPIYEYAVTLSPSPDGAAAAESTASPQNRRRMTMWELPGEADVAEMTVKSSLSTPPAATPGLGPASPESAKPAQASPPKGKKWSKDVKQKKRKVSADMSAISPF